MFESFVYPSSNYLKHRVLRIIFRTQEQSNKTDLLFRNNRYGITNLQSVFDNNATIENAHFVIP